MRNAGLKWTSVLKGIAIGALLPCCFASISSAEVRSLVVSAGNSSESTEALQGLRLVVPNQPAWINILPTSLLGPQILYPGETYAFRVDFEADLSPSGIERELELWVIQDSTNVLPNKTIWIYKSTDGFVNTTGECMDSEGNFCGGYITRDRIPPVSEVAFAGKTYHNGAALFISSTTDVKVTASDPVLLNARTQGVFGTMLGINSVATACVDLTDFYINPLRFDSGQQIIQYCSFDDAGNFEILKSTSFIVDGDAPGPVMETKVDGPSPGGWNNTGTFNITWNNPSDVSGVAGVRVKYGDVAPLSNSEGDFYPAAGSLLYSSAQIVAGVNVIWLWPEDNVGNADPAMAVSLELRYDGGLPGSTASAPANSGTRLVPVSFSASDAASGVRDTALWRRLGGAAWSSGTYVLSGNGGTFNFDTANAEGTWQFYTQACDNAGNCEPAPVSTTTAKAQTIVDATPPVISNVRVTEITYDSARISWETSEDAAAVLEYTLAGAPAAKAYAPSYDITQSLLLGGLVYPADYTFKITAANRAGLSAVYTDEAFYVPPKMTTNVNDMGVLNIGQPIIIQVTNPYVSSITYTLNGQTITQAVTPNQPVEIYASGAQGQTSLSLNLDGFTYATEFVVDTATRTVYLSRLAITDGGLDAAQGNWAAQAAVGQAVAGELTNVGGKAQLGYYAGIDPVAPGAVTNLAAVAGQADQAVLSWSAPGDDAYAGTAMRYDIRWATYPVTAANFSSAAKAAQIPFPLLAGSAQSAVLAGLNQLATYYFSLRTEDELGNFSSLSNETAVFKGYVQAGTVTVNGVSEISFVSPVAPSVALISTVSATGAVAIGSAAADGLTLAGNMYEIGPEGTYDPPAVLTFHYSTSTLAALGLLESDVAIYEHFPEGWQKLPGQVQDTVAHKITVPVSRIASLFAVFGIVKDRAAPVTSATYTGPVFSADGKTYIGAGSSVTLSAYDPVVYGTSTGVAFTEYRVDPGTASAFAQYVGSVGLTEGYHKIEFRSRDPAGNQEAAAFAEVYADTTAPVTAALIAGTTGQNGWHVSSSTLTLTAEDALSGLAGVYYRTGASTETFKYAAPLPFGSEGVFDLYFNSSDNVGNVEEEKAAQLKIDFSAPVVTAISSPAANGYGWNNTDVTVKFSCADAVSGVKSCPADIILTSEGVNISTSAEAFDLAGNSTQTVVAGTKIDKTAPQIVISSPAAGNVFVATKDVIKPYFFVADNLDPAPALSAFLVQAEDRGSPRDNRSAKISVASGQSLEPLDIDDGLWKLQVSATDFADNAAAMAGGVFEVIHDVLAPATTVQITGARYDSAEVSYVKRGTLFALSSLDDLVQAGDGIGLGVKRQQVTVSTGAAWEQQIIFDNPLPKQGEAFVSTFTLGQAWSLPDGRYDLAFHAEDLLGNSETPKHAAVGLDDTAPEVSAQLAGTLGDNGWHVSTVTITLAASDNLSGVAGIHYMLDSPAGDTSVKYSGAFATAGEGGHELAFFADDNLGNAAARQARGFKIDRSVPLVAAAVLPAANSDGWHNGVVKSVFTGSDTVSGIAYCEPPKTLLAEGKALVLAGYCRDYAGLSSTATARFNIDLTSPTITAARSPLANAHGWNNTDVTAVFTCSDEFSSIKYCPPAKVFAAEGAEQGVTGAAVDRADNSAAVAISGINIDKTAPQSALSLADDVWQNAGLTYLSPRSRISLSAGDPVAGGAASGVEFIEYRFGDAAFGVYVSSFGLSEGVRMLEYRAADKAGNVEAVRSAEFHVDGTPPASMMAIAGSRHDADGLIYITGGSGVVLTSSDPVSAETASGVLLTKYRLDGGDWQVYSGSFTVAGEGRHTLEYYSLDRVFNSEAVKTALLAVDNTAPLTAISLGEPRYEAFGLPLITPDTPVNLAAADVQSGEVASGLKKIFYEAVNAVSGSSGARAYTEPFKLPQGTWDIRYWSEDNLGNTEAYKQLRAAVTTLHAEALSAVDGLDLSGTADIAGPVKSNGTVAVSGSARILGDVTASTITLSGSKAQITGQRFVGAAPLVAEPILLTAVSTAASGAVPPEFLSGGRLVVSSQSELTLTTGTYNFKGIELSGGCKVTVDGKVDILVDGDVLISGGSSFNAAGQASALQVFVKGSSVTFTGGGSMAAVLYAPSAQMKLAGNALLGGHYFVRNAFISGNGNIVQAGEILPVSVPATGGGGKKVSALAGGTYSVLAGPDPEFKPGEVYVYPNPAKGGEVPTIHLECGIADSVNIKIYTVSGREAHSAVITSLPVALDDGNGLSYAYEYAWRGHIPSGVYYYAIEAVKAGAKIKKTGKFAVVR